MNGTRPETIPIGHKYACFAFHRFPLAAGVPDDREIAPGLWILRHPPVNPENHWREWLGSLIFWESPALLEHFRTEDAVDAFWRRPEHERSALWGTRWDLSAIQ
jgi:hypothetical protein